jgi:hypothetical protein
MQTPFLKYISNPSLSAKSFLLWGMLYLAHSSNAWGQMTGNNAPSPPSGISRSNKSVTIVQKRKMFGSEIISRVDIPFRYLNYGVFIELTPVGLNFVNSNNTAFLGDAIQTPNLYYPNPGFSKISFSQIQTNLHVNASVTIQDIYLGPQNQIYPYGATVEMKNYVFNNVTPVGVTDKISELYKNNVDYEYAKYKESVLNNFVNNQTTVSWKKVGVFGGLYNLTSKTGLSAHLSMNHISRQTLGYDNSTEVGLLNTAFNEKWVLAPGIGYDQGFFSSYFQANWNFLTLLKSENAPSIKSNSYYARFILALPITPKIKFGLQSENYFDFYEDTNPQKRAAEVMFMNPSDSKQMILINGIQAYLKVQF